MLQCVEDFETEYDGQTLELRAGVDRVGADHPIALEHPERFGPAGGIGGGERSRGVVHRMVSHDARKASRLPLEEELRRRTHRLADLAQRERERPAPASSTDSFWQGVSRLLADPRRDRQDAQDMAMLDQLEAQRATTLRQEREDIAGWLDD